MNDKIDMKKFLDGIDDKYIEEAGELENYAAKRNRIIRLVASVAAAVVAILLGVNVFIIRPWDKEVRPAPGPGITSSPEPTKSIGEPTGTAVAKEIDAADFKGGNDYNKLNSYRTNSRITNSDNSKVVVKNNDVVSEFVPESRSQLDKKVSEAVRASVPRPLATSNHAVLCYSIDDKNVSGEIILFVYDSEGDCVGFAEVSEDSSGLNCTMINSSKQLWCIDSKETFICVEYDGVKYLLDRTNTLYVLLTGEKADITIRGDLFSTIRDSYLAFSYEDVNKDSREIGYLGTYAVSDKISLDVYDWPEIVPNKTATSPSGKVAVLQQIGDIYYLHELVVTYKDKLNKYDLSSTLFTSSEKIIWLDDDTVVVTAHINPSLNVLFRCNEKTGVETVYGSYFAFDRDNKLFYVDPSPHFADIREPEIVKDEDGNEYYTTDTKKYIYGDLEVNEKYIAFYTGSEDTTKLIVVDRETKEVVIEIGKPICGDLRFSVKD